MATELKMLLTNKLSIFVVVLTLLWLLVDVTTRLAGQSEAYNNTHELTEIKPLVLPQLTTKVVEQLNLAYQQYDTNKEKSLDSQTGMTATEQAKQQGELTSVFIDDNKIELKAIIVNKGVDEGVYTSHEHSNINALILTTDIKSSEQKIEKFSHDSQVYGYHLVIENNTQVILTKQQPQGLQEIILTMYKAMN